MYYGWHRGTLLSVHDGKPPDRVSALGLRCRRTLYYIALEHQQRLSKDTMRAHGLRGPCRLSFETQAQSLSQLLWLPSEKEILIDSYAHGPKRFNLSPTTCRPQVRDTEPSPFLPAAVVRRELAWEKVLASRRLGAVNRNLDFLPFSSSGSIDHEKQAIKYSYCVKSSLRETCRCRE